MKLTAGVDEADMGNINPGQTATFTVEAYPNETFTGKVDSVRLNSVVQSNVVTYQVVIIVQNPDLKLRPGMTANTKIQIFSANGALKVPNAALRFRPNADTATRRSVSKRRSAAAERVARVVVPMRWRAAPRVRRHRQEHRRRWLPDG